MTLEMNLNPNLDEFYQFPRRTVEEQNLRLTTEAFLVDKEEFGVYVLRIYFYSGFFIEQYEKENGMFENIPFKQGYKPSQFFECMQLGKLKEYLFKGSNKLKI